MPCLLITSASERVRASEKRCLCLSDDDSRINHISSPKILPNANWSVDGPSKCKISTRKKKYTRWIQTRLFFWCFMASSPNMRLKHPVLQHVSIIPWQKKRGEKGEREKKKYDRLKSVRQPLQNSYASMIIVQRASILLASKQGCRCISFVFPLYPPSLGHPKAPFPIRYRHETT